MCVNAYFYESSSHCSHQHHGRRCHSRIFSAASIAPHTVTAPAVVVIIITTTTTAILCFHST